MRLTEAAERSFARHETFHPRYSWFRKAYAHVNDDPRIFGRPDAPVEIGVGKNMVRAIRFWGTAARLITDSPHNARGREAQCVPTRRGHALFGENGWDPYMEDPGTLWLLHWLLLAPRKSRLPIWWLAFNEFNAVEFAEPDLESAVSTLLDTAPEWPRPHPNSISKDVSALLRTYAPADRTGRARIDDMLDCPLRELSLLSYSPATGRFRFTLGSKPTLPSEVVAYAALDYVALTEVRGSTITLSRLTHASGAPGKAFKLTESELMDALRPSIADEEALRLATPTGAVQLTWREEPARIATRILDRYYEPCELRAPEPCAGPEGDDPAEDNRLRGADEHRSRAGAATKILAGAG
ncbi:MAG: DUF4007 family protein [Acidimicrobiaceae bacterium]|nr:DUF4007 family protein [Acidimicrobiaceae bacterium]